MGRPIVQTHSSKSKSLQYVESTKSLGVKGHFAKLLNTKEPATLPWIWYISCIMHTSSAIYNLKTAKLFMRIHSG